MDGMVTMGFGERMKRFLFPEDFVSKSAAGGSLAAWRDLADFLGLDPDSDPDAMGEATYYACLKVLREAIGRMPLRLIRDEGEDGTFDAVDHPLYDVLLTRPNRYTTSTAFWSAMEQSRNHHGNAYAWISGYGTPSSPFELWYMPPNEVDVWWDDAKMLDEVPDIYYRWAHGGTQRILKSREVVHLRASDTADGIMGIPLVDRLGDVIDGSGKAQRFQNKLISSGMTGKAVLQYTGELSDDAARKFSGNIERYIKGDYEKDGNKDLIPIPVGSQITPLNIKLTDAQFAELRKHSAIQIAAAFGIKPQQIGDMTKTSYASSQAQNEAFYTDTLLFINKMYEEEIGYKCLTREERTTGGLKVEFDTSTTLKTSFETQVKTLDVAVKGSLYTPNEARKELRKPAKEGGDVLLGNGNLIPLTMAGTQYQNAADTEGGDEE